MDRPFFQRVFSFFKRSSFLAFEALAIHASSLTNPFSTQRNRPLALYCVIEYLVSFMPIEALECLIIADGMMMMPPLGNLIASLRSQRIKWPPWSGLKFPKAQIAHQPQQRLAKSRCGKVVVLGPTLKVTAAKADPSKILLILLGDQEISLSMVFM